MATGMKKFIMENKKRFLKRFLIYWI